MTGRCDLTDLLTADCAHCRAPQPPGRHRQTPAPRTGWFEARYPGQCRSCGEWFTAGALIARDDDTGGWICEDCANEGGARRARP